MLFQSTVILEPINSFLFVYLSLELYLLYILEPDLKAGLKASFDNDPIYYLFILSHKRRGWRAQAYVEEQWNN